MLSLTNSYKDSNILYEAYVTQGALSCDGYITKE